MRLIGIDGDEVFDRDARYVDRPVRVTGDDPYGLDGDGSGYGCES